MIWLFLLCRKTLARCKHHHCTENWRLYSFNPDLFPKHKNIRSLSQPIAQLQSMLEYHHHHLAIAQMPNQGKWTPSDWITNKVKHNIKTVQTQTWNRGVLMITCASRKEKMTHSICFSSWIELQFRKNHVVENYVVYIGAIQ